tara:strand:+ start:2363 stop:3019 length:657 start_codon:yes stop_codon:yes gene_type:complete
MKNRDFKGIWIPKEIWLNNELKLIEKIFLVEIDSLDNESCCYASNKYFSEFFGITKGRCSQVINALEKKGLISIEFERDGKIIIARKIRVVNKLNRVYNKSDKGIKKTKGGYLENDKVNNTILNNTVNNKNRFKKPKIEDIKNYCLERKNNIEAQRFFDYYESKGWMVGKNKMKNWKAAVRNWENMRKEKTQIDSKLMQRLSSHEKAKQILKNLQNGN